jgi:hypothetical protein
MRRARRWRNHTPPQEFASDEQRPWLEPAKRWPLEAALTQVSRDEDAKRSASQRSDQFGSVDSSQSDVGIQDEHRRRVSGGHAGIDGSAIPGVGGEADEAAIRSGACRPLERVVDRCVVDDYHGRAWQLLGY